jgi:peroxiredoxin
MKTTRHSRVGGNPIALLWAALFFPIVASANAVVGEPAPAFTLKDVDGKAVNLADYRGKTVVLEWHNFGCPFVKKHYGAGNMQSLQQKYASDVVWLTVNSTNTGSPDYAAPPKVKQQLAEQRAAPARYLMDEPGTVGRAYGAKTTPHMYIIDAQGKLVYNGAIDDKRSTDPADIKVAKNYVAAALDEMKAGKPVSVASTTPYGCSVHYR